MVAACGTSSCSSPSRFASRVGLKLKTPVVLPPGRLRLATRPLADRIVGEYANDRDIFRGRHGSPHRNFAANGDEDCDRTYEQALMPSRARRLYSPRAHR